MATNAPAEATDPVVATSAAPEGILVADDNDSAIGTSDEELSTASLRSSIFNYQLENGRMYHTLSKGKYFFPNDEAENDRLDLQNHQFLLTFDGKYYFAPGGDTATRVLDVGTGTGVWAIDYADEHPNAQVIGVDLSPIQPTVVPPNCQFEVDDLEKEWTWSQPFDYIFARQMVGSFADWPGFMKNAYNALEPGGWLEIIDPYHPLECDDGTLTDESPILQWNKLLVEASERLGRSLADAKHHKSRLADAGFVNIEEKLFKWPTNTWPRDKKHKEVGLWTLANVNGGLDGLSMALFTRALGWTQQEVLTYLVDVRKNLKDRSVHGYWPTVVFYAQKPAAD